jgi:hypothetical protein
MAQDCAVRGEDSGFSGFIPGAVEVGSLRLLTAQALLHLLFDVFASMAGESLRMILNILTKLYSPGFFLCE